MSKNLIIGTKFFGHDSSIFVLDPEEKKVFAVSTERVTRIKHDSSDISPILEEYKNLLFNKELNKLEVVFPFNYQSPSLLRSIYIEKAIREVFKPNYIRDKTEILKKYNNFRSLKDKLRFIKDIFPNKNAFYLIDSYVKEKIKMSKNPTSVLESIIIKTFQNYVDTKNINVEFKEHHLCHATGAYYFSPFNDKEAIVFTLDGYGDNKYSSLWIFNNKSYKLISYSETKIFRKGNNLDWLECNNSIGSIYGLFTKVLGFTPNSDEGKTEALAAYGKPNRELYELLKKAYKVNKNELKWDHDFKIIEKLHSESYLRKWKEKIGNEDFAATIQRWLEDTVVELLNFVYNKYKIPRLAMAGGVVANVIMNLNVFERTPFEEIYIFPPMGDEGTSAGAAVLRALELGYDISWLKDLEMPYWGPEYSKEDIEKELKKEKWKDKIEFKFIGERWPEKAAEMVANGKIIAIYQGKMEFGPRALGNRSILADPRDPKTRDKINSTVKRRPWFQPFCPSVLEEEREII